MSHSTPIEDIVEWLRSAPGVVPFDCASRTARGVVSIGPTTCGRGDASHQVARRAEWQRSGSSEPSRYDHDHDLCSGESCGGNASGTIDPLDNRRGDRVASDQKAVSSAVSFDTSRPSGGRMCNWQSSPEFRQLDDDGVRGVADRRPPLVSKLFAMIENASGSSSLVVT